MSLTAAEIRREMSQFFECCPRCGDGLTVERVFRAVSGSVQIDSRCPVCGERRYFQRITPEWSTLLLIGVSSGLEWPVPTTPQQGTFL